MRSKLILALLVVLGSLVIPASSNEGSDTTTYVGSGMTFDYPVGWEILESPTGVTLYDSTSSLCLAITMHPEGCYPLEQHPMLLDYLLKLYGQNMRGTPLLEPITGSSETEIGPYSYIQQSYENPLQSLTCEIQGYTEEDVTVVFNLAIWDSMDPDLARSLVLLSDLLQSFRLVA